MRTPERLPWFGLLLVVTGLLCLPAPAGASSWQVINAASGLPGDQVNAFAVFRDRMAVGTDRGLAIYSGTDCLWKPWPLPDQVASVPVRDLAYDDRGNLWGATPSGVFHLQGDRCEVFGVADGLPTVDAERLQVKKGEVFVGSFGGFVSRAFIPDNGRTSFLPVNFRRESSETSLHLRSVGISGLAMESASEGWFSTRGAGLIFCKGMSQTAVDRSAGLVSDWIEAFWTFPGSPSGEHMLVATLKGLTMLRDGVNVGQVEIPAVSENAWITGVVTVFSDSYAEPPRKGENAEWTLPMFLGRRGLWVGTRTDGLCRYENNEWKQYVPANSLLPSGQVNRLYLHAGRIFVCTSGGLVIIPLAAHSYDEFKHVGLGNRNFKTIYPHSVMAEINAMEKRADFWAVTDKGLCRFPGGSGVSASVLEDSPDLSASTESETLASDSYGRPVTRAGELIWQQFYQENGTLYHNEINAFACDPAGACWMVFAKKVLARLRIKPRAPGSDERGERKEELIWDFFKQGAPLPWPDGTVLTSLWAHEGQIYVGTADNGFFVLENPGAEPDATGDCLLNWRHFSRVDGLTDEGILGFARWRRSGEDAPIVLRHKSAITLWDGKDFAYFRLDAEREYTCMAADASGNLWLGSNGGGVIRILPDFSLKQYTSANAAFESDRITALAVPPEQKPGGCALWVACVRSPSDSDVQPNVVGGRVVPGPSLCIGGSCRSVPDIIGGRLIEADVDGASLHYFDGLTWDKWKVPGIRCLLVDGNYLFAGTNLRLRRFFLPAFLSR